ncbi:MAG: septum formation protein [Desulforhopalus sp.]|jgi:septum formation protein
MEMTPNDKRYGPIYIKVTHLKNMSDFMYNNSESIVLASGSPRRKEFLESLGLRFEISVASIDELVETGELAEDFVLRMAKEKAAAVAKYFPDSWIISGDTVVCLGKEILGKPTSKENAVELLLQLAGQTHFVRSGFCLWHEGNNIVRTQSVVTSVRFTRFSERVARAYVTTGEPMDKAGGYGIQGVGGVLVDSIEGSYSNVVGLPMAELVSVLEEEGVISPVGA